MQKRKQAAVALAAGSLLVTGVGASYAASSATAKTHVLTFKVKATSQKRFGTKFIDTDKDVANGKQIGSDVLSGVYNPKKRTASGNLALALPGGLIYAHLNLPRGKTFTGTVTGGSGKFKGVSGKVTGTNLPHSKENVTVTYH